jgi:hypothetical protein
MFEALGLTDHEHMLQMDLFGVRHRRLHGGRGRLGPRADACAYSGQSDEAASKGGMRNQTQGFSFVGRNMRTEARCVAPEEV